MEKNFVLNGNKLIAEFMGYEYILFGNDKQFKPGWWSVDTPKRVRTIGNSIGMFDAKYFLCRKHDELRYWNEWNWLIPVVQKCMTHCRNNGMGVLQFKNALLTLEKSIVFNTVVEFIEWLNEQDKK